MNRFIKSGAWRSVKLIEYCQKAGRFAIQVSIFSSNRCRDRSSAARSSEGVHMSVSVLSVSFKYLYTHDSLTSPSKEYTQLRKFRQEPETRKDWTWSPRGFALSDPVRVVSGQWSIAVSDIDRKAPSCPKCLPGHQCRTIAVPTTCPSPYTLPRHANAG
jgi:hypothetical protein